MSGLAIPASSDPADLPVAVYAEVQRLHLAGDEIGLLNLVHRAWGDAYRAGFKGGAMKAFEVPDGSVDECPRCEGTGDRYGRSKVGSVCPECDGSGSIRGGGDA